MANDATSNGSMIGQEEVSRGVAEAKPMKPPKPTLIEPPKPTFNLRLKRRGCQMNDPRVEAMPSITVSASTATELREKVGEALGHAYASRRRDANLGSLEESSFEVFYYDGDDEWVVPGDLAGMRQDGPQEIAIRAAILDRTVPVTVSEFSEDVPETVEHLTTEALLDKNVPGWKDVLDSEAREEDERAATKRIAAQLGQCRDLGRLCEAFQLHNVIAALVRKVNSSDARVTEEAIKALEILSECDEGARAIAESPNSAPYLVRYCARQRSAQGGRLLLHTCNVPTFQVAIETAPPTSLVSDLNRIVRSKQRGDVSRLLGAVWIQSSFSSDPPLPPQHCDGFCTGIMTLCDLLDEGGLGESGDVAKAVLDDARDALVSLILRRRCNTSTTNFMQLAQLIVRIGIRSEVEIDCLTIDALALASRLVLELFDVSDKASLKALTTHVVKPLANILKSMDENILEVHAPVFTRALMTLDDCCLARKQAGVAPEDDEFLDVIKALAEVPLHGDGNDHVFATVTKIVTELCHEARESKNDGGRFCQVLCGKPEFFRDCSTLLGTTTHAVDREAVVEALSFFARAEDKIRTYIMTRDTYSYLGRAIKATRKTRNKTNHNAMLLLRNFAKSASAKNVVLDVCPTLLDDLMNLKNHADPPRHGEPDDRQLAQETWRDYAPSTTTTTAPRRPAIALFRNRRRRQ